MIRKHGSLLIFTLSLFIGCGGGGGGSDSAGSGTPDSNSCDALGLNARIINGTTCESAPSPIVKIQIIDGGIIYFCTGSMISPNKVLTASHCVTNETFNDVVSASGVSISLGHEDTPLAQASRIINNSQAAADLSNIGAKAIENGDDPNSASFDLTSYIERYGLADTAVIVLDRNLSLPTFPIRSSALPQSGEILAISGYGTTDGNVQIASSVLNSGEMELAYTGVKNLFARFNGQGSDTCNGDSGGPALAKESDGTYSLVGTTLGGSERCTNGDIAIFTATAGSGVGAFLKSAAPDATFK